MLRAALRQLPRAPGEDYIPHFGSPEEARRQVADLDWSQDGDRDLCPRCTCEKAGHPWGEPHTIGFGDQAKVIQFCGGCGALRRAPEHALTPPAGLGVDTDDTRSEG